jgi:hypothetical protein
MYPTLRTFIRRTRPAFCRFAASETGAITTDWIILTGSIVGISLAATVALRVGVQALAFDVETSLSGANVAALGTLDGTPQAPTAGDITRQTAWNSWCTHPGGPLCQFWQREVNMSDGSTWRYLQVYQPDGSSQITWYDQDNNVVDAPL